MDERALAKISWACRQQGYDTLAPITVAAEVVGTARKLPSRGSWKNGKGERRKYFVCAKYYEFIISPAQESHARAISLGRYRIMSSRVWRGAEKQLHAATVIASRARRKSTLKSITYEDNTHDVRSSNSLVSTIYSCLCNGAGYSKS